MKLDEKYNSEKSMRKRTCSTRRLRQKQKERERWIENKKSKKRKIRASEREKRDCVEIQRSKKGVRLEEKKVRKLKRGGKGVRKV